MSVVMICRTKEDQKLKFSAFYLAGQILSVCNRHIMNDKMEDDSDMQRQRRMLYVQANMLIRKLHFCSVEVKVSLFRAYFTPLYTAPLWVNYKSESLHKLKVAYNDALRLLLKKPRDVSQIFCSNGLITFKV